MSLLFFWQIIRVESPTPCHDIGDGIDAACSPRGHSEGKFLTCVQWFISRMPDVFSLYWSAAFIISVNVHYSKSQCCSLLHTVINSIFLVIPMQNKEILHCNTVYRFLIEHWNNIYSSKLPYTSVRHIHSAAIHPNVYTDRLQTLQRLLKMSTITNHRQPLWSQGTSLGTESGRALNAWVFFIWAMH